MITKKKIEDIVSLAMEDMSFEDFLEIFDLTPAEVTIVLFHAGLVDEEILETFPGI